MQLVEADRLALDAFTTTDVMRSDAATGYLGAWEPMRLLTPLLMPSMHGRLFGARTDGLIELCAVDLDTVAVGGLVGQRSACCHS